MESGSVPLGFSALVALGSLVARSSGIVSSSVTSPVDWGTGKRRSMRVLSVVAGLGILAIPMRIMFLWDWQMAAITFVLGTSVGSGAVWISESISLKPDLQLSTVLVKTAAGLIPLLIVFLWLRVGTA